ncbi:TonB-dependent receptor [Adhaeribacter rhizoryzae]|uniref:TonB-dependent receptor plug domain-containing protein n=1 Tax=Adhaeribacter rhizoryzae TaxID=2607907 RepID=A0A5M6CZC5_9BACT|nr:TonB-dependent receptor [Adhaeribacter rhizoryzae]KAA5538669.1 TonB-dependent receptor plug domain-containing protein [Adhaeribacter rhizoryzae]
MTRISLIILLLISSQLPLLAQNKYTISGYVREKGSQELLIGVSVYRPGTSVGTASNTYGFYSLTLPAADSVELAFSYVGYRPEIRRIKLRQNTELNIELEPNAVLQEVKIVGTEQREKVSEAVQMSNIEVPVAQIKNVPALLGEKDVMKVLQLMPGVQKGSEGNSGIYVRGGGPDQNLIILDDATVYNASHLFGFFSLFNGDALKSVEMTKGGFPARYGGRLSSVIELNMKDGNKEEVHGEGGIGLISSRLTVEGPLKKGVSSFLVSGRRTYADLLIKPFLPKEAKAGYYFYDLNTKVNYDFGRKNKLYISGYFGQDRFYLREKYDDGDRTRTGIDWGNATGTLRWNHLFNDRLFANASLIYSQYQFNIFSEEQNRSNEEFKLDYLSGIRDIGLKYDLDYLPNPEHAIRMGVLSTYHRFKPSALVVKDSDINKFVREVSNIDVTETGVYAEDTYRPFPQFRLNAGIRLSHFGVKGKSYFRPEPRLGVSYRLFEDLSLKASYATMNQFVHLLSNTGIGLPTDLWVPSTKRIAPQRSQQVALGVAKDFPKQNLSLTVEGYYKKSDNIIGYKEGASFLLIDDAESAETVNWENNITAGQGWSYGAEFLLQRKVGKFSGWLGYTLSWTQLQFDSLNFGKKYYARYDRRHDISVVGIYQPSSRITLSGTWVYGTGNAITMPRSTYTAPTHEPSSFYQNGQYVTEYGDKNSFRMAAYHRFDIGIQFHKKKRWGERTWEISAYNLYSRKNPFFYYLSSEYQPNDSSTVTKVKQTSLFPIIPSVSYSFKF